MTAETEVALEPAVETVVAPEPSRDEIDRIDPIPTDHTLSDGTKVEIAPLKTRQFFKMLRILTRGGAHLLRAVDLNPDHPEFVSRLVGLLLFAIPESEDETIEFLQAMVVPATLTGNKQQDQAAYEALWKLLDNPELDDTVTLIEAIIQREGEDIRSLGKRLAAMWRLAQRTGQIKEPTKG